MAWSITRPSVRSSRPSSRPPGPRMARRARARLSEEALMGVPSVDDASQNAVFKGRKFAAHARLPRKVDVADGETLTGRQHVEDGAPAVDHHAVAEGAASIGMLAD